jgi:hypothetical protein
VIVRFLRLFGPFRDLEQDRDATVADLRRQLQDEAASKLVLQDRLDSVLADRQNLWELLREALSNERAAFQMHINAAWVKDGHSAPYPDAAAPERRAPREVSDPIIPRAQLPSEAVASASRRYIESHTSRNQ